MDHRFKLIKRTFEKDAIIAFIDLLGTCSSTEILKAEAQAEIILYSLVSEFDIKFSEHFKEGEIKSNFDVSLFADSIAINQRIKTERVVERLANFLLDYQVNILLNRKVPSRAIITRGPFFSFKLDRVEASPKSILASDFTNVGLCGGNGVIQADKELKGLPIGVYVSEDLRNNLSAEQQNFLLPVEGRTLLFLKQKIEDLFSPFLSNNALKNLLACSEISEKDILSAIDESYSGEMRKKISPWILANMKKLERISVKEK